MGALSFDILSNINEGIIISPFELIENYLFGIQLHDQNGVEIPQDTIKTFIKSAQSELENYLGIKITKQVILESKDFYRDDYLSWSFVRVSFPVNTPLGLTGNLNNIKQIDYPSEWLSTKKTNQDSYYRQMHIVPNQGSVNFTGQAAGILPLLGITNYQSIPNYWRCTYLSGFNKVPYDILDVIAKMSALNVLVIAGDLILGPGLTNVSVGVDGLSQSIATAKSSSTSAYTPRINSYIESMKTTLPRLYNKYKGITITSL